MGCTSLDTTLERREQGLGFRDGIRVISTDDLSRDAFESEHLVPKIPVIITGCMESWQCYREWTLDMDNTRVIHLEALAKVFGHVRAPVINMTSGEKSCILIRDYCSDTFWQSGSWRESMDKLYLKDFHFCIDVPDTRNAYETPEYFQDDWLNAWFDSDDDGVRETFGSEFKKSDYRFLYAGPAGSQTQLHTDVLRSHSWSAQLAGTKQWKLLDPLYSSRVEDHNGICSRESLSPNETGVMTVIQYPGEIIFVPSGWYHEVVNVDNSLSINHNWIDSSSLEASWRYLVKEYDIATAMIEDCKAITSPHEFKHLVSRNVLQNCGFHRESFLTMVQFVLRCTSSNAHIAKRRQAYGQDFLQSHASSILSD